MSGLFPDTSKKLVQNKVIDGGIADQDHKLILPQNTTANLSTIDPLSGTLAYDSTLGAAVIHDGSAFRRVIALDSAGKLPAVDGSQLTNLSGGAAQLSTTGTMNYMNVNAVDTSFTYYLVRIGDVVTLHIPSFYPSAVPLGQSRYLATTIPTHYVPKQDSGSDEFDIQFICGGTWGRMVAQITPSTGSMSLFASHTTDNGSAASTENWAAGETLAINGTAGSWLADPL